MTHNTEKNPENFRRVLITLLVVCITNVCECIESCSNKRFFGPSCEYIELRYRSKKVEVVGLRHAQGLDCLKLGDRHRRVRIDVDKTQISWIRILTVDKNATAEVKVNYLLENEQHTPCQNEKRSAWENILDIYCEPTNQTSRAIRVDVEGKIGSTCDIYISGGRYLCDDGKPEMSTHNQWYPPHQCVDRNPHTMCQTTKEDRSAWWTITFNSLVHVYSLRVINKRDNYNEKWAIVNGIVKLYDDNSKSVWSYMFRHQHDVYEVGIDNLTSPVRTFKISRSAGTINLMEIEIYGESVCSNSDYNSRPHYGIACEKPCNCADENEQCLLPTGGCLGGCKAGFIGSDCNTQCKPYSYGVNCVKKCSIECVSVCDRANGSCAPCHLGFHGPRCDKKCQRGTFGASCAYKCPHCQDQRCNRYTGICNSRKCTPGWLGEKCNMECEAGTWGQNCSNRCSANCAQDTGCFSNGTCRSGCSPGFYPPTCFIGNVPKTLLNVTVWLCAALSICVIFELLYFCSIKPDKVKGEE